MERGPIVVIQDEPDFARLLARRLRALGYEVRSSGTAAGGLAAVKAAAPRLVVVELALPDMDGADLCRLLRRAGSFPILILTARLELSQSVLAGYRAKGYAYIEKPVSLGALTEKIALLAG